MPNLSSRSMRTPNLASRSCAALLAVLALALPGCSTLLGTRTDPPKLYVLTSEAPPGGASSAASGTQLGYGPITLPAYLERQGIVTRVAPTRLEASRNDLWAEPLSASFREVLGSDLRRRLTGVVLRPFPWGMSKPDLGLVVDVTRFEATSSSEVELHARWSLRDVGAKSVLVNREALLTQPIAGGGTEAIVTAMSQAVGLLADEIAAEVARQVTAPAGRLPTKR